MPQYAILRFAKHKGGGAARLEAHHERQKEQYASNPDIDTKRSRENIHIIQPQARYRQEIESRIQAAGCRTRKDSTRFVDTLVTASHEFFAGQPPEKVQAYFTHAADFLAKRVGRQNIISAVVHMDEKTPHLHLTFVPLTKDGRLSAKDILGNRAALSKWQDDFHAHMVQAYPELGRGELSRETGRRHIPMRVFKQAACLTKEAQQIESLLEEMTRLNALKERDEVIQLLAHWFPQMEDFEGQLKKYRGTIEYLQREKRELAGQVDAALGQQQDTALQIAVLKGRVQALEHFKARVPDEVKKEMEARRKQRQQER